jgi:hypothetical protein
VAILIHELVTLGYRADKLQGRLRRHLSIRYMLPREKRPPDLVYHFWSRYLLLPGGSV